jgi:hypothetical protein
VSGFVVVCERHTLVCDEPKCRVFDTPPQQVPALRSGRDDSEMTGLNAGANLTGTFPFEG